jgi:hypothetical protein
VVARWIALAVMLVTIAVIGIFVGAVLRPPATVTSNNNGRVETSASGAKRLTGRAGNWTVTAEITEGSADAVAIVVLVTDGEGRAVIPSDRPTAVLRMVEMEMGAQPVSLSEEAPGLWRGSGHLSMGGRWSLQINIGRNSVSLPFDTKSR